MPRMYTNMKPFEKVRLKKNNRGGHECERLHRIRRLDSVGHKLTGFSKQITPRCGFALLARSTSARSPFRRQIPFGPTKKPRAGNHHVVPTKVVRGFAAVYKVQPCCCKDQHTETGMPTNSLVTCIMKLSLFGVTRRAAW